MDMLMEYLMEAIGIALGAVLIFVIKQYVIPWLKVKIGNDKYDNLVKNVKDLIAAAEKQFPNAGEGDKKKEWVLNELEKLGIDFDKKYVEALIDGFCSVLTADGVINQGK